jgi:tetratricopeptide (TPR) repeat protein
VWQDLNERLRTENFAVVAVAEESRGAEHARPWIEQAKADYWCLIDIDHRLAALYGMVNVPQSVWIDAAGRIVRGPETAGSTDHFRRMDLATKTMAAEDQAARLAARTAYLAAVEDWARTGRHALDAGAARARLPAITSDMALADAYFRLGVWLRRAGRTEEAAAFLSEASRLHPASWNIWRQAADLDAVGDASGPAFWERVRALGDRPYYEQPDLPGF